MIGSLFQTILTQPLLNLLVFFYNITPGHDIGIAIIMVTLIVRVLLFPLSKKSLESQKALQEIQPKIEEVKNKFKEDKEKQAKEMMKLYADNKVNPFSSCLPVLIQLPFFIAVYRVFQTGLSNGSMEILYPFVNNPGQISALFLGFMNLANPQPFLAVIAGIAQFFQTKMMLVKKIPKIKGAEDENTMAIMNKQMVYMMPLITIVIGMKLPGGLTLYWLTTTLLMIFQQRILHKKKLVSIK